MRYRRSQLIKLPNGYLACSGPGTNDDAKGRDERTLDQLNAIEVSTRYQPKPHRGGNFDRMPAPEPEPEPPPPAPAPTPRDVFGTNLREYWIASEGVTVGTNFSEIDGTRDVVSWTGGLQGIVLAPTATEDFEEFNIPSWHLATARWLQWNAAFNYLPTVNFPSMRSLMNDRTLNQVLLAQGERMFIGAVLRDTNHENGDHAYVTGYPYAAYGNDPLFWLVRQVGSSQYRESGTIVQSHGGGSIPLLDAVSDVGDLGDVARVVMLYVSNECAALKIDTRVITNATFPTWHEGVYSNVDLIEVGNGSSGGLEIALLVVAANVTTFQRTAFEVFSAQYFSVTA